MEHIDEVNYTGEKKRTCEKTGNKNHCNIDTRKTTSSHGRDISATR